jgi:hypothetical protein
MVLDCGSSLKLDHSRVWSLLIGLNSKIAGALQFSQKAEVVQVQCVHAFVWPGKGRLRIGLGTLLLLALNFTSPGAKCRTRRKGKSHLLSDCGHKRKLVGTGLGLARTHQLQAALPLSDAGTSP